MKIASRQVQLDLLFYFSLLYLALLSFAGGVWYLASIVAEHWFKRNPLESFQMETNRSFHPGLQPKLTKEQKRKKADERRKQKEKRVRNKRVESKESFQSFRSWVLLPCPRDYKFMMDILSGKSYSEKMRSLQTFGSYCSLKSKSDFFPNYKPDPNFIKDLKERKKKCAAYMKENQRLRWIFKAFVTQWRIKRFRSINDSDFITLTPIENPIRVILFSSKCQYIFNAQSLLHHIHKRLLHNDGQIPDPLPPSNPYTNESFTLSQMLGIQEGLKAQGKSTWAFEAFGNSQFQIERFLTIYRKPLRLHAMKTVLYDYSDWEGKAILLNFIDTHHEEHAAVFQKHLYSFFLKELPEEVKIQQWRSLCHEYYEQEILAEDEEERLNAFFRIKPKTGPLCAPPHDLFAKRSFFLRSKKDESSRGV